jgi:hypothetical protein
MIGMHRYVAPSGWSTSCRPTAFRIRPSRPHSAANADNRPDLAVVETFQAAGVISRDLEGHYLGRVGLCRNQPGDVVMSHADLLITVG